METKASLKLPAFWSLRTMKGYPKDRNWPSSRRSELKSWRIFMGEQTIYSSSCIYERYPNSTSRSLPSQTIRPRMGFSAVIPAVVFPIGRTFFHPASAKTLLMVYSSTTAPVKLLCFMSPIFALIKLDRVFSSFKTIRAYSLKRKFHYYSP